MVTSVGFVVHPARPEATDVAATLRGTVEGLGLTAIDLGDDAPAAGSLALVVSVGGDGTFLRAARAAMTAACPVMGVKVGRLGFLTEAEPQQAAAVIADAIAGKAEIEQRTALEAEVFIGEAPSVRRWALNEVIVEKNVRHRLVRLEVQVDGEPLTVLSADGVIVATPTGSTAYSFSAGGPIVTPTLDCLLLTPVAAHMVFDRSLVLAPSQVVALEVLADEPGVLSTDGQDPLELPVGARVVVRRGDSPVHVVRVAGAASFLGRVREKFELPRGGS